MSTHTQLQVYQKEAKVLQRLHAKLSDQLSRLKVEELALLSQIRASQVNSVDPVDRSNSISFQPPKEEQEMMECKGNEDAINEQPLLHLEPSAHEDMFMISQNITEDEEEEEDDEMSENEDGTSAQDELAMFVKVLESQTQM